MLRNCQELMITTDIYHVEMCNMSVFPKSLLIDSMAARMKLLTLTLFLFFLFDNHINSDFVKGMSISENIQLAHELVRGYY